MGNKKSQTLRKTPKILPNFLVWKLTEKRGFKQGF